MKRTHTVGSAESPGISSDLTGAEIRAALKHLRSGVNSGTYVLKLGLCLIITAGSAIVVAQSPLWMKVLGVVGLGLMFAHAAELQHQAVHKLGFRNSRANTAAGVVLGIPMLISFAAFRAAHLRHHRFLGTPLNREFFDYGDQYGAYVDRSRLGRFGHWFLRFSMLYQYRNFLTGVGRAIRGAGFPGESAGTSRRIRRDCYIIMAALAVVSILSLIWAPTFVVWAWLAPLVLVAAPVHAAIELPEHYRCETLSQNPFANTRTIRSNRLMAWFTNGNNFHVEHHLMPNLPIERLPVLHGAVRGQLRYFHPGYLSYFRSLRHR